MKENLMKQFALATIDKVQEMKEASSGLEAVTAAVEDWLEMKGINGTIKIS